MWIAMFPQSKRSDKYPRLFQVKKESKKKRLIFEPVDWPQELPRLLFYTHSCRTTLTTNLAEGIIGAGTRYFAGHTWNSFSDNNLCERFFQRWIKGVGKDKPKTEFEVARLVDAFVKAAKPTKNACDHPRITNYTYTLTPGGPQGLNDSPLSSKEEAFA